MQERSQKFHQKTRQKVCQGTRQKPSQGEGDKGGGLGGAVEGTPPTGVKRRVINFVRGVCYAGMAFLLSGCLLPLGTLPLGLALLCASSQHTWYIFGGLVAGTLWGRFDGPAWVWIGVYALALLLRLGVLFFVEPPDLSPGGESDDAASRRETRNLAGQWASLKALLSDSHAPGHTYDEDKHPAAGVATQAASAIVPIEGTRSARGGEAARRGQATHKRLFNENPLLRIFTGAVCGFAAGLCGIILGGFAFYDLFAAILTIVAVPVATFLWIPCFWREGQALLFTPRATGLGQSRWGRGMSHLGVSRLTLVAVACLMAAVVYGARNYVLYMGTPYVSLRLAPLLAVLWTLAATSQVGLPVGMVVAALTGLAADPLLAPAFILCAPVHALLRMMSVRLGVSGGCVAALFWCAVAGGRALVLGHLLTFLLAIPLYLTIERLTAPVAGEGVLPDVSSEMKDFSDAVAREAREANRHARLRALSGAFSSLSGLFYDMSDRLCRPKMSDVHSVCEGAVADSCATCPRHLACRTEGRDVPGEMAAHMTVHLCTHRTVETDAVPAHLRAACSRVSDIVERVNAGCGNLTEQCMKNEKTEVFAADYEAMSAVLEQTLTEERAEAEADSTDTAAAERLYALLQERGIEVQGVAVCGRRERHIVLRGKGLDTLPGSTWGTLKENMEEICGVILSDPVFDVREAYTVARMKSEPRLEVSFAGSTVPAGAIEGEVLPAPLTHGTLPGRYRPPYVCGDHIAVFTGEGAYFYALISDGMGSGEEASLTSDICTVFLQKVLAAGIRPEIALSMLGSFLRQKNTGSGGECSATVDLMELDLFCGEAVFVKNGAPPTYVVRKGRVHKIRSRTMPIGILKDTPPDVLRFRTHPGDVVVMVSDGITHGNDECPWLMDMLSSPLPRNMDSLRAAIIRQAMSVESPVPSGTVGSPDDLSAIALRIEAKAVRGAEPETAPKATPKANEKANPKEEAS